MLKAIRIKRNVEEMEMDKSCEQKNIAMCYMEIFRHIAKNQQHSSLKARLKKKFIQF